MAARRRCPSCFSALGARGVSDPPQRVQPTHAPQLSLGGEQQHCSLVKSSPPPPNVVF